jgi:hypothetical protein
MNCAADCSRFAGRRWSAQALSLEQSYARAQPDRERRAAKGDGFGRWQAVEPAREKK